MTRTFTAFVIAALIGLALPAPASADTYIFNCQPSTDPAPPDWFGGPWSAPVRVVVDTTAHSIDLYDKDNNVLGGSAPPARLSSLNNYRMDIEVTENVIRFGVIEMWGFSGYIDRRTGRLDLIWTNPRGYSPSTLNRQFHGTCTQR